MARATERNALYPGSFDPPTNGHKWVMEKVSEDFDNGIVAVGHNPEKPGRFPLNERLEMLGEIAADYPNLIVSSFHGLFQADFAEMVGANVIVRGIRNADYNFENDISQINRRINPTVETVFRIPPNELQQVSSSMVMGLVGFEGWESQVKLMVPTTVFDRIEKKQKEKDKNNLERKWTDLHSRLGATGDAKIQFEDLYTRYEENHRFYHVISHIKTSLNELELVKDQVDDYDALELAIWFHDAIYESNIPRTTKESVTYDDEANSATLAHDVITKDMGLSQGFSDKVARLIIATKHSGIEETKDEQYMVDIDLAIFGRPSRLFNEYEEKIREEYAWVEEDLFRNRRAEVLESFLSPQRPTIYKTQFFQERYEEQARKNLQRSITNLRNL